MKKELQKEISDLAAGLMATKDGFNTSELKQKIGRLYEKLSVLEYLENQLGGEPISQQVTENKVVQDISSLDSKSYRENNWFKDPEPVPQSEFQDEIVEPVMEKIKDLVAQMPEESQKVDALLEEVLPKKEYIKNDLEEFASHYQETPVFERKETNGVAPSEDVITQVKEQEISEVIESHTSLEALKNNDIDRPKSVNDVVGRGLNIGLNDRLAFIKHLFEGRTEDYTRVLSQISSFPSFDKAETFIKGKVKPDYNYWLNKDEYSKRFMKVIEKSFD